MVEAGQPFSLGYYDPNKLELLETNARYMANDKFATLVSNVKRDKGLASVPLVYAAENPERPLVISGNHRTMAAREAKTGFIVCLTILERKTVDELVAIQLSHNAIAGADDLQTLKKLYDQITSMPMKAYSGIDEAIVKQLESIKFEPISEPRLVFKNVTFLFLPSELQDIENMVKQVDRLLVDDANYAFQVKDYAAFFDLVIRAKEDLKIKNSATAILELMRAGRRHLDREREEAEAKQAEAKKSLAPEAAAVA